MLRCRVEKKKEWFIEPGLPTVGFDPTTSGLKGITIPETYPKGKEVGDDVLRRTSSVQRG
jgi:hypothetical protein